MFPLKYQKIGSVRPQYKTFHPTHDGFAAWAVNFPFALLRSANARVDFVERLVRAASRREPIVRPAEPPV
jgi:hypothetical protein